MYNAKYFTEAITFSLRSKDSHLWNDMITALSVNVTQDSGNLTEF